MKKNYCASNWSQIICTHPVHTSLGAHTKKSVKKRTQAHNCRCSPKNHTNLAANAGQIVISHWLVLRVWVLCGSCATRENNPEKKRIDCTGQATLVRAQIHTIKLTHTQIFSQFTWETEKKEKKLDESRKIKL